MKKNKRKYISFKEIKIEIIFIILLHIPILSFSQRSISIESNSKEELIPEKTSNISDFNLALNSKQYKNIPNDSVYKPTTIQISLSDPRISHLIDKNQKPINPITSQYIRANTKNVVNQIESKESQKKKDIKNQKINTVYENFKEITFDKIDFVEIDQKIYYRLFIHHKKLSNYLPESIIDYNNYPGYILLEIKEDINKIAQAYISNGADSVKIINNNNIRVFKPQNRLDDNDTYENMQLSNVDYPGYFTYVRLEHAMYLPVKNPYPENLKELKGNRSTNSRHFVNDHGNIDAVFTIRPTSIPILPEGYNTINLDNLTYDEKSKLKWIELPSCYPVPVPRQTRDTYTITYDETYYGHSVYCTNDESHPYVWICSPFVNYLGTIGSMEDDDWLSGDEHNYNRIHDKFTISTIPDDATVTAAEYQTFLPDIPPYTTGDCDGLLDWEEVWPESKQMVNNITSSHDIHTDGEVDMFSHTWYNDVENGTVFYNASGWDWDRAIGFTGYDVSFNTSGLTDIENRLAANWYVVGIADKDENNQSPTYWQAVATHNYLSTLRISYIPCCTAPNNIVAHANGVSNTTVCPGDIVNLTFNSSTGGGCSCGTWRYAWSNGSSWWDGSSFSSGVPVYNSNYNSINTSITSSTTFTLRMECDYCGDYTETTVQVNAFTNSNSASSITGIGAICPNDNAILSVNGGSLGTSANWIWYSGSCGGTQVGTGSSISISPSTPTTYYVRAEGMCNTTSCVSGTVSLNTESIEASSAIASPATITPGNSSNLSISGGSLGTSANWQWYTESCGGTLIGSGSSINVSPTINTTYYVRAEGTCNNTACASVTVFVEGSVTICPGDIARLSIDGGALGTGATWNWYANSCGGTSAGTGTTIDVSPSATTTYYARAEGTCNTTGCASMQVIVNTESTNPTSISATNPNICIGGTTTLTVNGGSLGTGASWHWYTGSCGGSFIGTGASITVNPASSTNYYVRAEGDCNITSCANTTINVYDDPSANISVSSSEVCTGGIVSFTQSTNGGSGTITNQWQTSINGTNWTNWTTASNPTTSTLSEDTFFRLVRLASNNGCNDGISNVILVTVVPDPIINTQPTNPTPICIGGITENITTSVTGGTGSNSYQWQYYNGSTWTNVTNGIPAGTAYSGDTGSTFSASGFSSAGTFEYRCIISQSGNGCGQITTNTVQVIVEPDPSISIVGATTICSGGNVTLLASELGGTGTNSFQWQNSTDGITWSNISGATNATYNTPSLTSTMYYHAILSSNGSGCNSTTSNNQEITIVPDPVISTHPVGATICSGGSHNMSVSASGGTPSLTYQWQESSDNSTWQDIAGASLSNYTTPSLSSTKYYRVIVDAGGSACDGVLSNSATVIVVADPLPPTATKLPNSVSVCEGTSLTIASPISSSGGTGSCDFEYQFSTDGSNYSPWSTSVPSFSSIPGINSIRIRRNCNGNGCDPSNYTEYSWLVDAYSDGGTISADPSTPICAGKSAELSITGHTGEIQWQTNASGIWNDISGATSTVYNTPSLAISTSYRAILTSGVCSSNISNTIDVNIITPITTDLSGNDYVWTGASTSIWDGSTNNNWLKFISGSEFEIPTNVPNNSDNVIIRSNGACFATPPVVNSINVATCNNLNIETGNTLNINPGSNLTINGDLNNNGIVSISGSSPINLEGDWNNNDTFNAGSGIVNFCGSSPQTIKTNGDSFYDVNFNNTGSSTADLLLDDDMNITNSANFVDGIIFSMNYSVIFANGATTNSGTASSFVDAEIIRTGTTAFTYPTGDVPNISGSPRPIWAPIRTDACASSTINAQYFYENPPYDWWYHSNNMDPSIDHVTDREYWDLTTDNATPAVTLFWTDNTDDIHSFGTTSHTEMTSTFVANSLTIAHYNVVQNRWNDQGSSLPTTIYFDDGQLKTTVPFPNYSPITFASKRPDFQLPVELIKFEIYCNEKSGSIELLWETASETNNNYFVLERSSDARNFSAIANIEGAGNSNHINKYSFIDRNPPSETLYYKLTQYDFDGSKDELSVQSTNCFNSSNNPSVQIYPTIVSYNLSLLFENWEEPKVQVQLFDVLGKKLANWDIEVPYSMVHKQIKLPNLKPGVYMVVIQTKTNTWNFKIQKQ